MREPSMPNVNIITGRCRKTGALFGIRMEQVGNTWVATWSFPIEERLARREGYDKTELKGEFAFDESFPGCPHCHSHSFVVCGCEKLSCTAPGTTQFTCPWCRRSGKIGGETADRLRAGGDR